MPLQPVQQSSVSNNHCVILSVPAKDLVTKRSAASPPEILRGVPLRMTKVHGTGGDRTAASYAPPLHDARPRNPVGDPPSARPLQIHKLSSISHPNNRHLLQMCLLRTDLNRTSSHRA